MDIDTKERTFDRASIIALATAQRTPVACDLEGADLFRLDLTGWTFQRCNVRQVDLCFSCLENIRWLNCRGAGANLIGANLLSATFDGSDFDNAAFKGATISKHQAAQLLGSSGLRVV